MNYRIGAVEGGDSSCQIYLTLRRRAGCMTEFVDFCSQGNGGRKQCLGNFRQTMNVVFLESVMCYPTDSSIVCHLKFLMNKNKPVPRSFEACVGTCFRQDFFGNPSRGR